MLLFPIVSGKKEILEFLKRFSLHVAVYDEAKNVDLVKRKVFNERKTHRRNVNKQMNNLL
jgi:hypothetical protein